MEAITAVRFAVRSLRRTPARSALTALGVVIGVASVICTISIGNGAKEQLEGVLLRPQSRTIYVSLASQLPAQSSMRGKVPARDTLLPADYYSIRADSITFSEVSPELYLQNMPARANGTVVRALVEGIDVDGFAIAGRQILEGSLFGARDVAIASNVCVLSKSTASVIFGGKEIVGRHIMISDTPFVVVGIADDVKIIGPAGSADIRIYVPFTSLLRRLDRSAQLSIAARTRGIDQVLPAQAKIGDLIEGRRGSRHGRVAINSPVDAIKDYSEGSFLVTRLLAALGTVCLLVGGIGIMNTMLLSVADRTFEIGARLAIGTRPRSILLQFLLESAALGLLGGAAGIALGWSASAVFSRLQGWPTKVTISTVLFAVLCSLGVGLLFGYQPAWRAAKLQPFAALRKSN